MKKIIISDTCNLMSFDTITDKLEKVDRASNRIDYIYVAPYDCEVICDDKTLIAKEGDLILKMYKHDTGRTAIIINSDELKEFMYSYDAFRNGKKFCESDSICETSCE